MKLAIITSHPIQYNAPWFKLLAAGGTIHPRVFYTWGEGGAGAKYDPDFKRKIEWDIPLLEGYEYQFVENVSKDPGTHHFKGIINPGLVEEVKAWRPDAVLVFGWSFHSHLRCIRYFHTKIPVLFRGDSTLLDEAPGWKRQVRRVFLKWVYRHIDYALYVGQHNRDYFLRHGLEERQLVFAPHAIDNDRYAADGDIRLREARERRRQLNMADDHLVVLFAGKLEPKKNPGFLLQLAARIPDRKLRFIIAGNGVLESGLKDAAGADDRIRFLDFQNQGQMPVVYRMADVFILPSRGPGETWGLAVNEAMACGRAVMVSEKAGCAVDVVQEEENGITFGPDDLQKCERFLLRCLEDRKLPAAMGARSAQIIQQYSFGKIVSTLQYLLSENPVKYG